MLPGSLRAVALGSILVVCPVPAVFAQQPTWNLVGQPFAFSPAEMRAAAEKVPAEPFMEATVLFERDAYSVDAQGRMTYRHTLIYRVETKEGVDGWSDIRMRWAPWYQNPPEIRGRVIAADGKVSTLDPKTVTDGPAREDSEDTYTDERIRKAPLPGVAVGAIVETETVSSDKTAYFSAGEIYDDSFSREVPIVRSELVIEVPASVRLQYKVHNLPKAQVQEETKGDVHRVAFEHAYLAGTVKSDIDLPTHNFTGPAIEFSTGNSWGEVAQAYSKLAEQQIDPAKVKSILPQPGSDRMETIARVVATLHKEVRYTGIEFGEAALQPATAPEILKRHYGDCKDKAALLVAMLRAEGISANLALLNTGPGDDVDPELPGMNLFDHAIVYVPAEKDSHALWIDATAEFAEVGTLPTMDLSRRALVIADGTTLLTETTEPKPEDDQLVELRDVVLGGYGPAQITETSLTHGDVDSSYRSEYGGELSRDQKEDLEKYAKNAYYAKKLSGITHGDPHDLSKQFALKLDMTEAKRGDTAIDDALVTIPFADILSRLPGWFRTDPKVEGEKLTPQQEEDRKRAVAARTSEYDTHPFVTEWRYTITPPEGFLLRALPDDKKTAIGPASLSQHYESDPKGVVKATLRFEQPKLRLSSDEVLALREAVLATYKQDGISVWFDQVGSKLAQAGKTREALAADRALIASHPAEGLHHAQIAYLYLKAGLGDKARKEAETATQLAPKLPVGYRALGWMCEFNAIGVQWGSGFDWNCAAKALKKAIELDPEETAPMLSLAYLDEYDSQGERYAEKAHLADAVAGYRAVKEKDKSVGKQYDDHILFDLFYGGRFKEVLEEVEKLPSSPTRRGLTIAATVALQGGGTQAVAAGISRADHLTGNADDRNAALTTAGNQLIHLRLYPEAAGILSAAVEGQQNSANIAQQIAVFRQLKPWKGEYLPATNPAYAVQRMYITFINGTFNEEVAREVLSRHAYYDDEEWQHNLKSAELSNGMLRTTAEQSGLPGIVLLDVIIGNSKFSTEGDDNTGYRVTVGGLGSKAQQYFVSKEEGAYRIISDGNRPSEAGNAVLYLLKAGREKEARSLLDWMRDRTHKGGGDDPLSGPLFPRFWTVGGTADADVMRTAADSLLAGTPAIKDQLPWLRAAWEKAKDDERLNLGLLLATGYYTVEDGEHSKEITAEILKKSPDSYTAIRLAGGADDLLQNWDDWKQMLDSRIAKHPDDENLLRMRAEYAQARKDWSGSRAALQVLFDKGTANANDYNMYGWTSLFDSKVDDDAIKAARQATMLTKSQSFAELHTLACLYAEAGKTSEARDLLLKAMEASNIAMPNPEIWFGFGRIYEQFGVNDAAIKAYEQIEKPRGRIGTSSTYVLAQSRLKALKESPKAGPAQ